MYFLKPPLPPPLQARSVVCEVGLRDLGTRHWPAAPAQRSSHSCKGHIQHSRLFNQKQATSPGHITTICISRYLLSPLHCVACFQSVFSHTSTRTTWIKLVGRLWFRSGFSRDHFFNGQVTNVLQFWHWWTWIFTIFRKGLPPPFPCRKWLRLSQFISHFIMVSSLILKWEWANRCVQCKEGEIRLFLWILWISMFIEVKIGDLQWALYCSLVVTSAAAAAAPRVHCRSCRTFYEVSEQLQRGTRR